MSDADRRCLEARISTLEAELAKLWEYADWEAESMLSSHTPCDEEGPTSPYAYHSIKRDYGDVWERLLEARAMRRHREPEIDRDRWFEEPE